MLYDVMKHLVIPALAALFLTACSHSPQVASGDLSPLKIASWNMEHLAETDGSGCRPRSESDYADMRRYVSGLDADVIAFQEVESKAAAERVFDPETYTVVIEDRVGSDRGGACRGLPGQTINAQRTGFAVRRAVPFERLADFTEIQVGNPDLRSGVDVIVRPRGGEPLRLLSVHLKSGCSSGDQNQACAVFFEQVPVLERWIDQRADESVRFAVLGDFNRRLAMPADVAWSNWDDGSPANADLALASADQTARCNPRYLDFIDFIVLDRRAAADLRAFEEATYGDGALSDHCAITATLAPADAARAPRLLGLPARITSSAWPSSRVISSWAYGRPGPAHWLSRERNDAPRKRG
jgi:endonuclease/exonuclease/phosphatase family metal-dependent hydrolase